MSKVAIATDNSGGFSLEDAEKLGIKIIPIPFIIDGEEYIEFKNLTREQFFTILDEEHSISTSQPAQSDVKACWNKLLEEYDEVVYIPLSSGLSATCKVCQATAAEYNGKVEVVDNKRVSVTLKATVLEALKLAEEGKTAKQIKTILETDTYNASIYITLTTLKYLKKGGRITAAAAAIGSLLKIKPVLQIQGDKLDAYAKVLTMQQAKQKMLAAIQKDLDTRFKKLYENNEMGIAVAHSGTTNEAALYFAQEVKQKFPNLEFYTVDALPLSITCHIGKEALAVAVFRTKKGAIDLIK